MTVAAMIMKAVQILFLLMLHTALAEAQQVDADTPGADTSSKALTDDRLLVELPGPVQTMIRHEMRQHLVSLQGIIAAMADQRLEDAANIASKQLGSGSMGRHRASGGGPGRHLPAAMRSIGMSMHAAADALAEAADAGNNIIEALQQLGQITAACSGCHSGYRIR